MMCPCNTRYTRLLSSTLSSSLALFGAHLGTVYCP